MKRIPTTFAYPVVYPNGAIIYCETKEEADFYRNQIKELAKENKNESNNAIR